MTARCACSTTLHEETTLYSHVLLCGPGQAHLAVPWVRLLRTRRPLCASLAHQPAWAGGPQTRNGDAGPVVSPVHTALASIKSFSVARAASNWRFAALTRSGSA